MNLFFREIRASLKGLVIWCVSTIAIIAMGFGKYSGMSAADQSMNDLVSKMPGPLKAIIGGGDFDLTKASGYYGVVFGFLLLAAAIYALLLGVNMLAKEERDKTAEFLLVKPITRNHIVGSKLLASIWNIVVFTVIIWVVSLVLINQYGNGEQVSQEITLLMAGMLMIQLVYLSIGLALSTIFKDVKRSSGIALGILLLTYFISIAIDITESLEGIVFLTPFKYLNTAHILAGGGLDAVYTVVSLVLIVVFITATFVLYKKRDMNL
jgi:ABC-2 type transport system permease protein